MKTILPDLFGRHHISRAADTSSGIQPFKLVKYFSFTSFAVILVGALMLSWVISNNAKKVLLDRSEAYSELFAENLSRQVFLRFVLPTVIQYGRIALSNEEQFERLDQIVRNVTRGMGIDSVTIFDSEIRANLPAKSGLEDLRIVANTLADHTPEHDTDVAMTLHRLAEKLRRRALVIVFSDLFDDLERVRNALAHFRRRRHDVVVYHVLDKAEIEFPFRDVGNFLDLESGETLITNPREVRSAYQEAFADFLQGCQRVCAGLDIEYVLAPTDRPVGAFVQEHMIRRKRAGR